MTKTAILLAAALTATAGNSGQFTSFAGFTLDEATTLADVTERFGRASLLESGEAGGYEASVCYVTNKALVSFRSHEMGGPEHRLLGFAVSTLRGAHHCAPAPAELEQVNLEVGGVKLGMTHTQFVNRVGAVEPIESMQCHFSETEVPMSAAEAKAAITGGQSYFDETISVCGTFERDVLVEYLVWRIRTT
jgi:hypothetical protein